MTKTLVIYAANTVNSNLLFFLNNGYIENSENIDFYVCFNNDNIDISEWKENIKNNNLKNLHFIQRPNLGYDFGAWIDILYHNNLWEKYDYYILLNSTCMGPFIPLYEIRSWVDIFTNLLNDKVKLVGPTINVYENRPHVQSYMLCFDKELFIQLKNNNFLIKDHPFKDKKIYDDCFMKEDFVNYFEVGMSQLTLLLGYQIKSLLKGYETINYYNTLCGKPINLPHGEVYYFVDDCVGWDPCGVNRYFGITMHPYEVIFYKSNRGSYTEILEMYKQFHNITIKKDYVYLIFYNNLIDGIK